MKKSPLIVACLFTLFFSFHQKLESKQIRWFTNYEEGVQQARLNSKPVAVLFTATDWCSWCKKLEREVFEKSEFAEDVGDKFVFIKLDFRVNDPLPQDQVAANKQLQKQFNVKGYPTLILLDGKHQQLMGQAGYLEGGPKVYANHLMEMLNKFNSYQNKMQNLENNKLSGLDLKQLYEQATLIGRQEDTQAILVQGLLSEQPHFFRLEKYRLLSEAGHRHSNEAVELRNLLLAADPNNQTLTHYQIALIDFDAMNKMSDPEEITAAALIDYTERFGAQDKDNLWRVQMIISQVYFDKHNLPEALKYAQSSYQAAPSAARTEIATAIKQMQLLKKDKICKMR